jgi:hypothetical protein
MTTKTITIPRSSNIRPRRLQGAVPSQDGRAQGGLFFSPFPSFSLYFTPTTSGHIIGSFVTSFVTFLSPCFATHDMYKTRNNTTTPQHHNTPHNTPGLHGEVGSAGRAAAPDQVSTPAHPCSPLLHLSRCCTLCSCLVLMSALCPCSSYYDYLWIEHKADETEVRASPDKCHQTNESANTPDSTHRTSPRT